MKEKKLDHGREEGLRRYRIIVPLLDLTALPEAEVDRRLAAVTVESVWGIGPRYADRKGGYLRITKLQKARKRDGVRVARVEFV